MVVNKNNHILVRMNPNSSIRVYDTGSNTKYKLIQAGNMASVYLKVYGGNTI
jgi:hypothetical protein